ncbi:MAG: signal peptidase II [Anaerolineales bacterium]|nr:signal peptidase II [Anaerolineales bacterium]
MTFYLIIMAMAFFLDRLSKWWAGYFLAHNGTTQVNTLITLRETYNRGLAFGRLQGVGQFVGWLSIGVLALMFIYLMRLPREMWLLRLGLALIIGGAAGNLVDRVLVGAVLDFIETPWRVGIFNLADVAINAGMVVSLLGLYWQRPLPTSVTP